MTAGFRLPGDDGQEYMGGVSGVGVYGVRCDLGFIVGPEQFACVWVGLEAGGVAGGYGDADAMAGAEYKGCGPEVDLELVDLAGLHQLAFLDGIAMPRPDDTVQDYHASAVGVNVAELGGEVGIGRGRRGP